MSGTPKTLAEAIEQGRFNFRMGIGSFATSNDSICASVKNFFAQVFTTHMVLSDELKQPDAKDALKRIWNDLFPGDKK